MLIGSRLKELRQSRGVTQSELGEKLGVTKASICCYEKGARTPTLDNLEDMVNFFEVSADYLLGYDKRVLTNKDNKAYYMTAEEVKFIEYLRKVKNYDELIKEPLIFISKING